MKIDETNNSVISAYTNWLSVDEKDIDKKTKAINEDELEIDDEPTPSFGYTVDGWNKDDLEILVNWLDQVQKLAYEIKNCRRGAYCQETLGTLEGLHHYLDEIKSELDTVMNTIEENLEK